MYTQEDTTSEICALFLIQWKGQDVGLQFLAGQLIQTKLKESQVSAKSALYNKKSSVTISTEDLETQCT